MEELMRTERKWLFRATLGAVALTALLHGNMHRISNNYDEYLKSIGAGEQQVSVLSTYENAHSKIGDAHRALTSYTYMVGKVIYTHQPDTAESARDVFNARLILNKGSTRQPSLDAKLHEAENRIMQARNGLAESAYTPEKQLLSDAYYLSQNAVAKARDALPADVLAKRTAAYSSYGLNWWGRFGFGILGGLGLFSWGILTVLDKYG
jgi:hypothetical protein